MTADERRAFMLRGTKTASLATVRDDGRPHVTPIWFDLDVDDHDTVVFTTAETSLKGRSIRRDPNVALCIDDQTPPFAFVLIEGVAEISEDPQDMLGWATRIGGRYMGSERAAEFGVRNAVPGELLVRVRATRVIARAGIADRREGGVQPS
jgi:PPOX class probable F420-dependent enzyme